MQDSNPILPNPDHPIGPISDDSEPKATVYDPQIRIACAKAAAEKNPEDERNTMDVALYQTKSVPSMPKPLEIIGPYELIKIIGEGGMGTVYLAQQWKPVKRSVALKLIRSDILSHSMLRRFQAEQQTLALMDHPQIAKVLDAGSAHSGEPFFVMELIPESRSLTQYADEQKLSLRKRIELFITVCQGVQHAHQKGIIHRDLKPSNILVGLYDGKALAKIIDFGVAKATRDNLLMDETKLHMPDGIFGTLEYMSPEQANRGNQDIDTRSDVYALGIILCELLTGTTPLRDKLRNIDFISGLQLIEKGETCNLMELISESCCQSIGENRRLEPHKLRGYLAGELNWITQQALAKDRNHRYASAAEFAADLQRYLDGEAIFAHPPSKFYQFRKIVKKHRWPFGLAATVMISLGLTTLLMVWQQQKTIEQKNRAENLQRIAEEQRTEAEIQKRIADKQRTEAEIQKLEALQQKQIAESQKLEAEKQKQIADKERIETEKQRKIAESQKSITEKNLEQMERGFEIISSLIAISDYANYQPRNEISGDELKQQIVARLEQIVSKLNREEERGNPEIVAKLKIKLAITLLSLGKYQAAHDMLDKMYKNLILKLGKDNEQTINCLFYLVWASKDNGQYKEAIHLGEECAQLHFKKWGKTHQNSIDILNILALAYRDSGQPNKAITILEDCLKVEEKFNQVNQSVSMGTLNNLALAYQDTGNLKRAVPLLEKSLALHEQFLSINNPKTLTCMSNLALAYQENKDLKRAISLNEKCLALKEKILGKDHPSTLNTLSNLAAEYQADSQVKRAITIFEDCLKLKEKKFGPEHPSTLATLNNLAVSYRDAGQLGKAIPLLEKCSQIMQRHQGKNNLHTCDTLFNLAIAYQKNKQSDRAIPLFEDCLQCFQSQLGKNHIKVLNAKANLASAYTANGQAKKAIPYHLDYLNYIQAQNGNDNPHVNNAQLGMGYIYLKAKEYEKAEKILRVCYEMRSRRMPNNFSTASIKSMLGESLMLQMKFKEAEPYLVQGYEELVARIALLPSATQSNLKLNVQEARNRLIQFYDSKGDKQKADRLRELDKTEQNQSTPKNQEMNK